MKELGGRGGQQEAGAVVGLLQVPSPLRRVGIFFSSLSPSSSPSLLFSPLLWAFITHVVAWASQTGPLETFRLCPSEIPHTVFNITLLCSTKFKAHQVLSCASSRLSHVVKALAMFMSFQRYPQQPELGNVCLYAVCTCASMYMFMYASVFTSFNHRLILIPFVST